MVYHFHFRGSKIDFFQNKVEIWNQYQKLIKSIYDTTMFEHFCQFLPHCPLISCPKNQKNPSTQFSSKSQKPHFGVILAILAFLPQKIMNIVAVSVFPRKGPGGLPERSLVWKFFWLLVWRFSRSLERFLSRWPQKLFSFTYNLIFHFQFYWRLYPAS